MQKVQANVNKFFLTCLNKLLSGGKFTLETEARKVSS